jgi:hypothetical protein
VLLSDDLGEFLGTVFTRQDGVAHAGIKIIRDPAAAGLKVSA